MLLSRASTIKSLKGYTGFKVNKPFRERKQLPDGISAVRWPIFRTKCSNVSVEKSKCINSKKVEKKSFIKKVHIWAVSLQIMWQFCPLAYVICVRKPVNPSKFCRTAPSPTWIWYFCHSANPSLYILAIDAVLKSIPIRTVCYRKVATGQRIPFELGFPPKF